LADWLGVSAHWLRFGAPPERSRNRNATKRQTKSHPNTAALSGEEARLMEHYRLLTQHQQALIAELTAQLALEREVWSE
jgi:hypothetical protein